jgi:hypothetical protein
MTIRERIPAISALTAGAALAVVLLLPTGTRGPAGNGAAFVFTAYAEALAIAGLGVALSRVPFRPAVWGIVLFAAGLLAGWAVKDRVLAALVERPGAFEYTGFIGPAACLLAGAALAAPGLRRVVVAPAAAVPVGAAIGFVAALNDPSLGESQFFTGAASAAFWLLLAPLALLRSVDARYVATGGRILASWLIAIGLMLGGVKIVGRPAPLPEADQRAGAAVHFAAPDKPRSDIGPDHTRRREGAN